MNREELKGWGKDLVPQFFTDGNVRYQLIYNDVEDIGDGYKKLALSFDVSTFAVSVGVDNISVHVNKECNTGCYFVPFISVNSKKELAHCISKLVSRLGESVCQIENTHEPVLKINVFRYIDRDGKKSFAISGTNLRPKDEKIHKLNIKTMLRTTIKVDPINSWFAIISEMQTKETPTISIKKESILDFEKNRVIVNDKQKHVITLLPKDSVFFAKHHINNSLKTFFDQKTQKEGCVYNLCSVRMSSHEELNLTIKELLKSFRELTGNCFVDVIALYQERFAEIMDVSIAVIQGSIPLLEEEIDDVF